mgnify:CR=1 FL=1
MELAGHLARLQKRWVSIVVITVLGLATAAATSLLATPTYTATTSLFFRSGNAAGELQQGSAYAENQVKSFAQVVTKPVVLDPVIVRLGLTTNSTDLAKDVTASVPSGTAIIEIDVVNADPELAARLANEIGAQLIVAVGDLSPTAADKSQTVKATTVEPALVPTAKTSPRVALNLVLGLLLGLLLGFVQAVLRDRRDTTISSEADVADVSDRSVVGVISFDPAAAEHPLVFSDSSLSPRAEAYRRLRTNLQFLSIRANNRSVVVTSSIPGEGRTTSAINLAIALADAGDRVLLIDADLRRPKIADYLRLEGAAGLTTILIGRAILPDLVQPVSSHLDVLTAGEVPPNPAELLGSDEMEELITQASRDYSQVILDCPPTLAVSDSTVLAHITGGVLVVVGSDSVHKPELAASLESLESVDGRILGLVLNKVRVEDKGEYGYHHYHSQYRPQNADAEIGG